MVKHPELIIKEYEKRALDFESHGKPQYAHYAKAVADCLKERKDNDKTSLGQDEYECRDMARKKYNM